MIYRFAGGTAFLLMGLNGLGLGIPAIVIMVLLLIAGIALLAGA